MALRPRTHRRGGGGRGREERGGRGRKDDRWLYAHGHRREGERGKRGEETVDRWPYAHGHTEREGEGEERWTDGLTPTDTPRERRGREGRWTDGLTPTDTPRGREEGEEKKYADRWPYAHGHKSKKGRVQLSLATQDRHRKASKAITIACARPRGLLGRCLPSALQ